MKDVKNKFKEEKEKQDDTFNMTINKELKKQFNIKCIENGTLMARVLKDYIRKYVKD